MLIRWRGGVPRFLRPTTGAGGWAAAAAGSQPLSPAPATTAQPLALAPAQARAPRPRGGAGVPRSVLLACGFCSQELSHRTEGKALHSSYLSSRLSTAFIKLQLSRPPRWQLRALVRMSSLKRKDTWSGPWESLQYPLVKKKELNIKDGRKTSSAMLLKQRFH